MTLARSEGYKEATVSSFRSDTGEVRTSTNQCDANGIVLQKTQQANVFKQLVVMGQVFAFF